MLEIAFYGVGFHISAPKEKEARAPLTIASHQDVGYYIIRRKTTKKRVCNDRLLILLHIEASAASQYHENDEDFSCSLRRSDSHVCFIAVRTRPIHRDHDPQAPAMQA